MCGEMNSPDLAVSVLCLHSAAHDYCNVDFVLFLANMNSRSLYAVARPSVVCLSVMLVHPTQAIVIFRNISAAFGTLVIR